MRVNLDTMIGLLSRDLSLFTCGGNAVDRFTLPPLTPH